MNRIFKVITVPIWLVATIVFAQAQDSEAIADKQKKAQQFYADELQKTKEKWAQAQRQLEDLTDRQFVELSRRQEMNCHHCHRGDVGEATRLAWDSQSNQFSARSDTWGSYYTALDFNSAGLTSGGYQITELHDSLLRAHLRLKDRPALVVTNSRKTIGTTGALETGDVLLSFNDQPVENAKSFQAKMDQDPNAKVEITLLREGKEISQAVQASELGTPPKAYRIGVQVESPSDALRSQLNLSDKEGLLIVQVLDEPQAKNSGLMVHDVLLRMGDTPLTSFEELKTSINQSRGNEIEVAVIRKGEKLSLKVTPYAVPEKETWTSRYTHAINGVFPHRNCPALQSSIDTDIEWVTEKQKESPAK